jgi:hypothetical protein
LLFETFGHTYTDEELAKQVEELLISSDDEEESKQTSGITLTTQVKEEPRNEEKDDGIAFLQEILNIPSPNPISTPKQIRIHTTTYVTFQDDNDDDQIFEQMDNIVTNGDTTTYLSRLFYTTLKQNTTTSLKKTYLLKTILNDGVTITLSDPTFYYEIENQRKHQVQLPLTPTIMSQMPDPKYRVTDNVTYALFSVMYKAKLDYTNLIDKYTQTNKPSTPESLNQQFINNTTKLLQRLQDVAEARQRKGPERTLQRMTQIITDYANDTAQTSRKRTQQDEPYVPKDVNNIEIIDLDTYTPTPCPIKRIRIDDESRSRPIHRQRTSVRDRLGSRPYHL